MDPIPPHTATWSTQHHKPPQLPSDQQMSTVLLVSSAGLKDSITHENKFTSVLALLIKIKAIIQPMVRNDGMGYIFSYPKSSTLDHRQKLFFLLIFHFPFNFCEFWSSNLAKLDTAREIWTALDP